MRELAGSWPNTRASRIQLRVALGRFWTALDRQSLEGAVRVPTKPRYACRALSEPQAAILARCAAGDDSPAGLAVALALYAGLRRLEIASLRWSDVDLESGWLRIVGKGDVTGELPLHPELARKLDAARSGATSGTWVFPGRGPREHVNPTTVWTWSRRLSERALGLEVATHRLRHTAIATLNDRTGDLRTAQAFARHVSPETTTLYTRVSRSRLEAAVAAIIYEEAPA